MNVQLAEQFGSILVAPPKWFWVASGLGLIWNLIGVVAFVGQMMMDLSALPAAERTFYDSTPVWVMIAFAVAVSGGVLGCAALLLRQSWAYPMLMISLAGIVVQISHSLLIGDGIEVFGPAGFVLPLLTFGIGAALAGLAHFSVAWVCLG